MKNVVRTSVVPRWSALLLTLLLGNLAACGQKGPLIPATAAATKATAPASSTLPAAAASTTNTGVR